MRSPGNAAATRAIALEVVVGREDAAFQLVRREAVLRLERSRVCDELIGGPGRACSVSGGIAVEEVRRERDAVPDPTTENVADGHAPRLPEDIQAREFDRGNHLGSIVVKRGGRVREQEAHLFEPGRIAAEEVRLHPRDAGNG